VKLNCGGNMQGLSIPTDNVNKFYAIFGLIILVSCIYGFVNIYDTAQKVTLEYGKEVMKLDAKKLKTEIDIAMIKLYTERGTLERRNQEFYYDAISLFAAIGTIMLIYGLVKWHFHVQPVEDKLKSLQIENLRLENITHNKSKYKTLK
jgi:hypothetical protein